MKTCTACKIEKPHSEFQIRRESGRPRGRCRSCSTAYSQAWRAKNRERDRANRRAYERANPHISRNWYIKARYGLTGAQYDALLEEQGGSCAICRATSARRLHVDHDHISGKVRGLLCGNCNRMLGCARDLPENLARGAAYLVAASQGVPPAYARHVGAALLAHINTMKAAA